MKWSSDWLNTMHGSDLHVSSYSFFADLLSLTFQLLALFLALLFVVQLQHKAYKVFHLRLIQLQVDEMWYFIF